MWVGQSLFRPFAKENRTYEQHHLAQMEVAQVSKCPATLLGKGKRFSEFFDGDGSSSITLD